MVASAVLPPTEHAGIRLHDNHYRAVVAPSAVVEVAVPACAYSVPSHSRKGTQISYDCSVAGVFNQKFVKVLLH